MVHSKKQSIFCLVLKFCVVTMIVSGIFLKFYGIFSDFFTNLKKIRCSSKFPISKFLIGVSSHTNESWIYLKGNILKSSPYTNAKTLKVCFLLLIFATDFCQNNLSKQGNASKKEIKIGLVPKSFSDLSLSLILFCS